MFYVSVPPLDHGLLAFPTNAYGGFAYRANTLERAATAPTGSGGHGQQRQQIPADPTRRFVTEHNLGLFWRRPGLFPRALALPLPLLHTADAYATGVLNRPPGMMRVDCAPIRYRQRNLLAGELVQSDGPIRIWTVNDSSDHKQLLHYNVRVSNSVADESANDLLWLAPGRGPVGRVGLDGEVLQLKAFVEQNQAVHDVGVGKVFLRSKNALQLADTAVAEEATVSSIFHAQTLAFTQIPHMDGELAVVDSRGMLFWGNVDEPGAFVRYKCPTPIKDICQTDCPRILVSIDERECRVLDLREPNCAGQLLFTHSFGSSDAIGDDGPFSDEFRASLTARDQLCRVQTVDIGLETVLVTSSRRHTLVDPRMPGQQLLTMAHAEIDGADYSIVAPPFVDRRPVAASFHTSHSLTPKTQHSLIGRCFSIPANAFGRPLGPNTKWTRHGTRWNSLCSCTPPVPTFFDDDDHGRVLALATPRCGRQRWCRNTLAQSITSKLAHLPVRCSSVKWKAAKFGTNNVFFDPLPKLRQDDGPRGGETENDDAECEGSFAMEPIDGAKLRGQCLAKIAKYQTKRKALDKAVGTHFFVGIQDELMAFRRAKQKQRIDLTALEIASEFVARCPPEGQNAVQNGGIGGAALSSPAVPSSSSAVFPFAAVHRISADCCAAMDDYEHQLGTFDDHQNEERNDDGKLFSTAVSRIWHKTLARWHEAREARTQIELGLMKEDNEDEAQQQGEGEAQGKAKEDDEDDEEEEKEEEEESDDDENDKDDDEDDALLAEYGQLLPS
ncbi:hypothetical protein niasHS_004339 [Heterodera schachtii]|uniref:Uncharacterized protein n=1 Tax=Heterodera schachtii TaxID=97005 RepID=A0ABD2JV07_HETSC